VPAGDVDLRLVVDLELVALERLRQIALQCPALAQLGVQGIVVEAKRALGGRP
jgi:hypothetical protein